MKLRLQAAFTLIELLVVITIIGILASFALPALQNAQVAAQQTKALSNARQVVGAMRTYASDNDGNFPSKQVGTDGVATAALANSNQAFRLLFPNYLTSEGIFYVPKSKWSINKPDDKIDAVTSSGGADTLRSGENHWAYFPGLTDSSNSSLPLVADGFAGTAGVDPKYVADDNAKGGVWKGKIAITVRIDQSAEKLKCAPTGTDFFPTRTAGNSATKVNYFKGGDAASEPNWLRSGVNDAVNPDTP